MKKIIIAALLISSGPVSAMDWDGFYAGVGISGDYSHIRTGWDSSDGVNNDGYWLDGHSVSATGFAGHRWSASDTLVLGLEGRLGLGNFSAAGPSDYFGNVWTGANATLSSSFSVAALATIGVPVGSTLAYAGLVMEFIPTSWNRKQVARPDLNAQSTSIGMLLSAGIDVPLSDAVFFRADYTLGLSPNSRSTPHGPTYEDDLDLVTYGTKHAVTLGLGYRF